MKIVITYSVDDDSYQNIYTEVLEYENCEKFKNYLIAFINKYKQDKIDLENWEHEKEINRIESHRETRKLLSIIKTSAHREYTKRIEDWDKSHIKPNPNDTMIVGDISLNICNFIKIFPEVFSLKDWFDYKMKQQLEGKY